MLHHILQAFDGTLPAGIKVCFVNTGKEMPQTLDFVQACAEHWHVSIVWLEFNPDLSEKFEIVGHNSASRNGEPFERTIEIIRICISSPRIQP
jgi:3'-phosphoadenosine 5'-phosphosulfate sulfotransferase (PAPS reductase)/FAD synthetase